jgi:excinuclease ABC subunit A
VRNLKGPWQEIAIKVHWQREVDTPAFREFLSEAQAAFLQQTENASRKPEDMMPWKVLGKKWHLLRKGFPSGKRVVWSPDVVEELIALLEKAAPDAEFDWGNKQSFHVKRSGESAIWCTVHTKRRGGVDVLFYGEPGEYALGRVATLGKEREIVTDRSGREAVKVRLTAVGQVRDGGFRGFVEEHAAVGQSLRD